KQRRRPLRVILAPEGACLNEEPGAAQVLSGRLTSRHPSARLPTELRHSARRSLPQYRCYAGSHQRQLSRRLRRGGSPNAAHQTRHCRPALRGELRPALACQIAPLVAVIAIERCPSKILNAHRRRALAAKPENLGRSPRQINDAVRTVRPAIVDAYDERPA